MPAACTLPTAEQPLRIAEFAGLFAAASVERRSPVWLRVRFAAGTEAVVRDLTARESACCSFFDFAIADGSLDIRVPPAQTAVLDGLERLARTP